MDTIKLIGLSFEEATALAKKEGLLVRAKSIDGKSQYGTADARRDRVNVTVVNGKVDSVLGIG